MASGGRVIQDALCVKGLRVHAALAVGYICRVAELATKGDWLMAAWYQNKVGQHVGAAWAKKLKMRAG